MFKRFIKLINLKVLIKPRPLLNTERYQFLHEELLSEFDTVIKLLQFQQICDFIELRH